jgi:hypothetical protein
MKQNQTPILNESKDLEIIPFEEELNLKDGMAIDSADFVKSAEILLTFLVVLVGALFSGYFGPSPFLTAIAIESFNNVHSSYPRNFASPLINFSRFSRSLIISFVMERKPRIETITGEVSFTVEVFSSETSPRIYQHVVDLKQIEFNKDSQFSTPFSIFHDQTINYSSAIIRFSFSSIEQNYIVAKIIYQFGNVDFIFLEIFFRSLFFIFLLFFFCFMLFRLKIIPYKMWSLEQKLTLLLLLISMFYNNPLYGNIYVCWTTSYIIDAFAQGIFVSFLLFYFITLLDYQRFKNRETNKRFFIPKVLIFLFLGILMIFEGLIRVFLNINNTNSIELFTSLIQTLQELIFQFISFVSIYLFVVIVLAFQEVDPTEKFKLSLYVLSFSICLIATLISNTLKIGNALIFTIQFSIPFLLSVLMAYFHCPYDLKEDFIYEKTISQGYSKIGE